MNVSNGCAEDTTRIGGRAIPQGSDGIPAYLDHRAEQGHRPSTIQYAERVLGQLDRHIGLENLTPRTLRAYCEQRGLAPASRYTYYTVAATWSAWNTPDDQPDPFRMAKRPAPPHFAARPITEAQLGRILDTCKGPAREYAILAAFAGLRRGEIAQLRGDDLVQGLLGPVIQVRDGKGGIPGEVPAHPMVVEVMERYGPGRMFPVKADSVGATAARAFARCGVHATLHQLRHYYATTLYRRTHDVQVVQHAMRHQRLDTTSRYIQPDQDDLFGAILDLPLPGA